MHNKNQEIVSPVPMFLLISYDWTGSSSRCPRNIKNIWNELREDSIHCFLLIINIIIFQGCLQRLTPPGGFEAMATQKSPSSRQTGRHIKSN